uniref:Uncharacterized protein n=1 Tax=Glossina brevipalpis TaxID=37001 RepID=A0A1A9WYH4_9MUSC
MTYAKCKCLISEIALDSLCQQCEEIINQNRGRISWIDLKSWVLGFGPCGIIKYTLRLIFSQQCCYFCCCCCCGGDDGSSGGGHIELYMQTVAVVPAADYIYNDDCSHDDDASDDGDDDDDSDDDDDDDDHKYDNVIGDVMYGLLFWLMTLMLLLLFMASNYICGKSN